VLYDDNHDDVIANATKGLHALLAIYLFDLRVLSKWNMLHRI